MPLYPFQSFLENFTRFMHILSLMLVLFTSYIHPEVCLDPECRSIDLPCEPVVLHDGLDFHGFQLDKLSLIQFESVITTFFLLLLDLPDKFQFLAHFPLPCLHLSQLNHYLTPPQLSHILLFASLGQRTIPVIGRHALLQGRMVRGSGPKGGALEGLVRGDD